MGFGACGPSDSQISELPSSQLAPSEAPTAQQASGSLVVCVNAS